MTDVVEIARSRRSKLAAEIARLDEFVRMAEMLLKYGNGPGTGREDDGDGSRPLVHLFDLDADSEVASSPATAGEAGAAKTVPKTERSANRATAARAVSSGTATTPEGPNNDSKGTGEKPDHFDFSAHAKWEGEELVLTQRDATKDGEVDAEIGQRLRQRRWMIGMTTEELADRIGESVAEVEKYERGEAQIDTGRLWKLVRALGVSVSYFYDNADEQARSTGATRREGPSTGFASGLAKTA